MTATFRCCQAAGKAMIAQGEGGAMVNIGSIAASMAMYGTGAYSAAKGAVASFSRCPCGRTRTAWNPCERRCAGTRDYRAVAQGL